MPHRTDTKETMDEISVAVARVRWCLRVLGRAASSDKRAYLPQPISMDHLVSAALVLVQTLPEEDRAELGEYPQNIQNPGPRT